MSFFSARRALAAVLFAAACYANAEAPFSFASTPGKLPKDVIPVQYAAHLVPDVVANTFLGSEAIEIDVLKATSRIVLNAAGLAVDSASLSGKAIGQRKLEPILDEQQQTLSFTLAEPLAPGRYQLALKFHGTINREARGLFYLRYKAGAADQTLIATNMEPSDARRLMPLWDEPSFRANFKLTVDLPASFKAYSNTPVETQEKIEGGLQRIAFRLTPKMPSYLLVLVAGQFERSIARQDGVEIGVVTTAGKQASTAFVLDSSKDLLRYYNKYFGVPYPLPKLDHIAIPGGFNGAMENWGAIVYSEAGLLYDAKTSPERVKLESFTTNAHEMAHQWFGNLVTMAWWDNLWLNEGFASWMSTKASVLLHPEWRAYLAMQAEREHVMNLDARKTTHPIQTPVETEEQAADAFDDITYIKGEAFLHMLEAYLGEAPFRKGIRAYMARHQYSNTTSADLWSALEKASGKPVRKLASDWTTQPGFPLLKVTQACENGRRRITLTQEQYRIDEPVADKLLWSVPLQLSAVNGKPWHTLLAGASATLFQPGCEGVLVVDPAGVGYFRVQYDSASFDALAAQAGKLPDASRLRLVADTWSLVQGGRGTLEGYTKLLSRYGDEPRLAVWNVVLGSFATLDALAKGGPERALVQRRLIALAAPRFARLGWGERRGEAADDRQLRPLLASALARAGHAGAAAEARAQLKRYLADPASVQPSMLDFAFDMGARDADPALYEELARRALKTESANERERLIRALTSVRDVALVKRTLQLALSPALPAQITTQIVPAVAQLGQVAEAWRFATANREALMKDQDSVGRNSWFPSLMGRSSNAADAAELERYVAEHFGADAQVEAQRVAHEIRTRAAQKEALMPQVRAVLQ